MECGEPQSRGALSTTMEHTESLESWAESSDLALHSASENYFEDASASEGPPPEGLIELFPVVVKKRRGRRPLRPLDPIRKKTEEKDKYWLRAFRAYMRAAYPCLRERMSPEDRVFWEAYLSPSGKPGKGGQFSSYGRAYKSFLFSKPTFMKCFRRWFTEFGEAELAKKCARSTDLWFVFYDYASKDLYGHPDYHEDPFDNKDSPLICAQEAIPEVPNEFMLDGDIEMKDHDSFVEDVLAGDKAFP